LGSPDKHNVYEAEAVGALLALWILENTPATVGKTVSLYIDNQALVTALPHPKASLGQYLIDLLRTAIDGTGCNLTIRWISGHSKIRGNEEADRLAKEAAAGRSSPRDRLPHVLRRSLPTSASALKQTFMHKLKDRWAKEWEISPRKARVDQFGDKFPFTAFVGRLNSLTRNQASLLIQIRCGHFPLNNYLHKIKKINSNSCTQCSEDQEGPPETVHHFFFDCPAHEEARNQLTNKIGINHFTLKDIMAETNRMKALTTFINRTGRLQS
jgi:hypothetical protein